MIGASPRTAAFAALVFAFVASPARGQQPSPVATDTIPGDTIPGAAADTMDIPPTLSESADSVLRELRALPGFIVTEYQGDRATYTTETGVLRLQGDAEVMREGDRLSADTIEYSERESLVTAIGGARVVSGTQDIEGATLYYDVERRRATALAARTQIEQEATWYFTGGAVTLEGTTRVFGRDAHFTSCDLAIPHYHFESDEVMVIRDRILVARPARLYFGKVPVMVLPFVVQNLERGRRSGFLTPRFGLNDIVRNSTGYNRQISNVGFYWAINDYLGAEVSTDWRSGAYTALLGNLQFSVRRRFLDGNVAVQHFWEDNGDRQFTLNGATNWRPDERTSMSLTARFATESRFIRDVTYDPLEQTRNLGSSLRLNRRFDWGSVNLGGDRQQSIANGDVTMTLPSLGISVNSINLFPAAPGAERWYSNASFNPGAITASRQTIRYGDAGEVLRQEQDVTRFRAAPSFSIGRFTVNGGGSFERTERFEASGFDEEENPVTLPGFDDDAADWSLGLSYRQPLVGSSSISPNIRLTQQLARDTATAGELIGAPVRLNFGAGLNTDVYGFFPGVGPYSAIRHRVSPTISYNYSPRVQQTELQERVFGPVGGRTQNAIRLTLNQTFEAKLSEPRLDEPPVEPADTLAGDTLSRPAPSVPSDPQKVTILSLNTSALEYDFEAANQGESGFRTETISNTINSDYLRGLQVRIEHELFDRSELDPNDPGSKGRLGRFSPRLISLSTGFQLGPQTAIVRWVQRLFFGERDEQSRVEDDPSVMREGPPPDDRPGPNPDAFTGNPQFVGGGPWNLNIDYSFRRNRRTFGAADLNADQSLNGVLSFQLTPNWSVNWRTNYSVSQGRFGGHALQFRRDLHEWQAVFDFYQAPNGNTGFAFYVELLHNRDIRFDYRESDLGVDRP